MPAYDATSFDPPAPIARVAIRDPGTGKASSEFPALLDTGADVTLLPQSMASEVGVMAEHGASYQLAGFDGSISVVQSADLDLIFLARTIRGRYLLHNQDYGILGRDVINLVSLLMDGPGQVWSARFGSAKT